MNYTAAQPALSLPPSASDAARESPLATLRALWEDRTSRRQRVRAETVFRDIDAHTLRDIGAPNWVLAEATLREGKRELYLLDLYRS